MRILVTGGSGLLGSHLIDSLLAAGHTVHNISTSKRNSNPNSFNCYFDLRNQEMTKNHIAVIKPEMVFHLAANAAENLSVFSPIEITTSNYDTFWNVLVPSINAGCLKRFVFTSSIAVYGAIHVPFREQDLPLPQDVYGVTKLAIEQSLRIMSDVHGFEYVIVRPHNVFGENQRMDDPYRNVIALWMNQLLKNEPYAIYGDGSMKRCFSYVKDVVDVIEKCGTENVSGMVFNVGGDEFYSLNELSDMIQEVSGVSIKPTYLPSRVHEVQYAVSDHTLMNKVLGYKNTPLKEALEVMWSWAKTIGPQGHKYANIEIKNNNKLPSNWKR